MLAFLVRVILFALAISVLRSVVTFIQRAFTGGGTGGRTQPTVRRGTASQQAATMLQRDPVCGTYVAIDTSLKRVVHGKVLHFCSAECRDKYAS